MLDTDFERYIYSSPKTAPADEGETLFTTFADRVQIHINRLLTRDGSENRLSLEEHRLLLLLRDRVGIDKAMPAGELCEKLHVTARDLKQLVHDLRLTYRIQIGASRDAETGGYYLISTEQESLDSSTPMLHQAIAMLRVVKVLRSQQTVAELCGQVRLELEKEATDGR